MGQWTGGVIAAATKLDSAMRSATETVVDLSSATERLTAAMIEMLRNTVLRALAPGDTLERLDFVNVEGHSEAIAYIRHGNDRFTARGFGEDAITAADSLVKSLG